MIYESMTASILPVGILGVFYSFFLFDKRRTRGKKYIGLFFCVATLIYRTIHQIHGLSGLRYLSHRHERTHTHLRTLLCI